MGEIAAVRLAGAAFGLAECGPNLVGSRSGKGGRIRPGHCFYYLIHIITNYNG